MSKIWFIFIISICMLFSGCATKTFGPLVVGDNIYRVSREEGAFPLGNKPLLKEALQEANNYCSNFDKIVKIIATEEHRQIIGSYPRATVTFSCISSTTTSKKETLPGERKKSGSGSAFIISDNGYIITCYHVIDGASKVVIFNNSKEYPAKLILTDKHNDLALLKIDGTFPALSFAQRNSVKMGSDVFTIGYPNPILQGVNQKLTKGNINALTGFQDDVRLYQISTPVQPGNSGGALLNKDGDVVGIIVAVLKAETAFKITGSLPQNVNYAMKSTYIQALIDTVPEAIDGLQKPNGNKSFGDVVERVQKSVVMVLAYE